MRTPLHTDFFAASAVLIGLMSAPAFGGDIYDPALDQTFDLGDFALLGAQPGGDPTAVTFDLEIAEGGDIVGFSFIGMYAFEQNDGSWASDTRMVLSGLGSYDIGGVGAGIVNPWTGAFPQGGGSDDLGLYETGPMMVWEDAPLAGAGGSLSLSFTNDWLTSGAHDVGWADVTFTIHRVPGPGGLALLGLAAVAGRRRRR